MTCEKCGIKITSGTTCPECARLLEDLEDKPSKTGHVTEGEPS